jgi:hypothetical protein
VPSDLIPAEGHRRLFGPFTPPVRTESGVDVAKMTPMVEQNLAAPGRLDGLSRGVISAASGGHVDTSSAPGGCMWPVAVVRCVSRRFALQGML